MGNLTQALSIALSGLQTSSALISLASNNISNASTAGYTDKTADVTSVDFGASFGGTQIASYGRATNDALTTNYNTATSAASYTGTQNTYMTQIQTILDSTSSNPTLSSDIANFSSAWNQYASSPESNVAQQGVITAGQTLANDIQSASASVGTLVSQVQGDISNNVSSLNADLKQIASVNTSIQDATTTGLPTGDLQDQLGTLVNQVSNYMNVSVQSRANGQIALFTPSGQLLVDSAAPQTFSWNGTAITDTNGTNVTGSFTGGSLQAATDFISNSTAATASSTPGVGVIGKFNAQMSTLINSLTSATIPTTLGGTTSVNNSFANTYSAAVTASTAVGATQAGDPVASSFFTVTNGTNGQPDPSTFNVNTGLTASTSDLPQSSVQAIANSFNAVGNYTASGLSAQGVTYAGLTSGILSSFQQTANIISSQSTTATSQQTYYQQSLSNATGVNIDTELANLVAYQNSYAASAHVISTVNQMLTTLMGVLS